MYTFNTKNASFNFKSERLSFWFIIILNELPQLSVIRVIFHLF
jgi:hypothetical protein